MGIMRFLNIILAQKARREGTTCRN